MTAAALIHELADAGIRLSRRGECLRVVGPRGSITPALRAVLAEHKPELLDSLSVSPIRPVVRFRLRDAQENAWATALGAPQTSIVDLVLDLRERYGPRVEVLLQANKD